LPLPTILIFDFGIDPTVCYIVFVFYYLFILTISLFERYLKNAYRRWQYHPCLNLLKLYSIWLSYSIWLRVITRCVNHNFVRCIVHVRMVLLGLFYCHSHWFCCVYLHFNFVFLCLLTVAWKVYFILYLPQ
jgi:hypothetical protein